MAAGLLIRAASLRARASALLTDVLAGLLIGARSCKGTLDVVALGGTGLTIVDVVACGAAGLLIRAASLRAKASALLTDVLAGLSNVCFSTGFGPVLMLSSFLTATTAVVDAIAIFELFPGVLGEI